MLLTLYILVFKNASITCLPIDFYSKMKFLAWTAPVDILIVALQKTLRQRHSAKLYPDSWAMETVR